MTRFSLTVLMLTAALALAEEPSVSYIFPAGGQRGTTVKFHVGGHFLHGEAGFAMYGPGVSAAEKVTEVPTKWFEGPVIPLPASQQKEDYPKDHLGQAAIAADAPLGERLWRVWTSQGATPAMKFVVGDLPEVIEDEIDGLPIPVEVKLPLTINGRIFPREDVDIWSFQARRGQTIWCEAAAARLGSPLEPRLEIRGSEGRVLAESGDYVGADAFVAFTAPADGTYQVRIHDINFGGLQHYVYRLTISSGPHVAAVYPAGGRRGAKLRAQLVGTNVPAEPVEIDLSGDAAGAATSTISRRAKVGDAWTNSFLLETGDLPEALEQEPNNAAAQSNQVTFPAVANGRIDAPGDVDRWSFAAKKGQAVQLDLVSARLGSPLDSVLKVLDAAGKELARSDDLAGGQTDSQLTFTAPADGTYTAHVQEQFPQRGGPRFVYRLTMKITPAIAPKAPPPGDFQLTLANDAVTVLRGKQGQAKLDVQRSGGFNGPIELKFAGLPQGVTVSPTSIPAGQNNAQLTFKAEATARIGVAELTVTGSGEIGPAKQRATRTAMTAAARGSPRFDRLCLAVGLPTPFKFTSIYNVAHGGQGTTLRKRFQLQRNGFEGPLTISLADRQIRHLQGVTGPKLIVPPGASEFEYPAQLPTFLEIGRTSRTILMAVGEIADTDGRVHRVSYSSPAQNEQIVLLADAGPLSVTPLKTSLAARPGTTVELPLRVECTREVTGPVTLELALAEHVKGVSAEPVTLSDRQTDATLHVRFADRPGPFNLPLVVRATGRRAGDRVLAEAKVDVVAR
jgi:hypothetical protein